MHSSQCTIKKKLISINKIKFVTLIKRNQFKTSPKEEVSIISNCVL